jgi:predicted nucleic acid-binding protein
MRLPHSSSRSAAIVVLDTQCVLDWAFFADPRCSVWAAAQAAGQWHWIATLPMRAELEFVLHRGFGARWTTPTEQVLALFDACATLVDVAPAASLGGALRCSDASDQKFIDLATSQKADYLVSRDRAVLKLRKRAWVSHGLRITPPSEWTATFEPVEQT